MAERRWDAVVVGSGPNGLVAAIALAERGHAVLVLEAAETLGGGLRSAELTLPGVVHDVCSAVHPLALASPVFRALPLASLGVELIQPDAPLAHPFDDGSAVVIERSLEATAAHLDADGAAWHALMAPFVDEFDALVADALGPLRVPRHPLTLAHFGRLALQPAAMLARSHFSGERARAVFAGIAAHAMVPLEATGTATFGLLLGLAAHAVGWPIVRGGSQRLADGLATYLRALGGEIRTGQRVTSLRDLPAARAVLFDITPRQLLAIAGDALPARYRRQLARYRYGMGAFKLDLAIEGPIPWRADECRRAATVHLGGTPAEIAASERAIGRGGHPQRPYVIVAQPSLFDPTRAPAGIHTLWAYCHVPHGSSVDMTERIIAQLERFAPGLRERILASHALSPAALEARNANNIGGDINGGVQDLRQLITRPVTRLDPYATPNPRLFLCSSSTPPGGGVHGLCGWYAARSAMRNALRA